ncbi:MAG: Znf/thioredoxin put protein [Deltaproteobacteria bacterium]|nr:Znf/thioredoxin put protein [Deltaproteobacteria bacterium]
MRVQCPNCKTTYKVADEVLKGAPPAFRCSRCKHTFEIEAMEPLEAQSERINDDAKKDRAAAADPELSFSFAPKADEIPAAAAMDTLAESDTGESPAIQAKSNTHDNAEIPNHQDIRESEDSWTLSNRENKVEKPFTLSDSPPTTPRSKIDDGAKDFFADDPIFPRAAIDDDGDDGNNIVPMSSYTDQQASILPYLTLLGLLVIVFSLIVVITHAHPKASESFVKNIPLLGPSVFKNKHLKDGILIQSLRGGYQTIHGNREVFVVTGVAVNQNPVVIRELQLTGKVFSEVGKELEQQTIWVGNTLSPKILRGMTPEDIPHLQNLKPLKSFELPPGDSIPFAMVFLKSTKSAKDFTCEVVLADSEV